MKKRFLIVSIFVCIILSGCSQGSEEEKIIKIIHTNDTHSRIDEGEFAGMGFARLATLIENIRKENPNTLLIDAGDTFHGQTIATLVKGESIVDIMNAMNYDYMVPGNHDFNYGYHRLLQLRDKSNFKILAANIKYAENGENLLQGYDIKEIDGVKLGIFGLATPETTFKTHPNNVKGLLFKDPIKYARETVEILKKKADIIVCIGHIGLNPSSSVTSKMICEEVDDIDIFIDGHSHTILEEGMLLDNGTLIVSTGEYDKNLGIINLTVLSGKIIDKKASLISKEKAMGKSPDMQVQKVIEDIKEQQDKILSEVIGHTDVRLEGERARIRTTQTNLGTMIAMAMIKESGADIALVNGGGIRSSIDVGDITKGEVITTLPFGHYIVTTRITGRQLKDALEHGTGAYPEEDGRFPQVANIAYSIDTSKALGDRIQNIIVSDKPVNLSKTYILATNDFLYAGGDDYTMFTGPILSEYTSLDEALIKYINSESLEAMYDMSELLYSYSSFFCTAIR